MLRLENFSFCFDAVPVLRELPFHIPRGGYLSIIWPNGAGKSTLLKYLMGLHESGRQQGEAYVNGRRLRARTILS